MFQLGKIYAVCHIFLSFLKCGNSAGAVKFEEIVRGADPHSTECGRTVRGA